jgi:enoyl-CoA hydratase
MTSTASPESSESSSAALDLTRDGAVATLTLCRPEVMNRIDALAHDELTAQLRALAADRSVRAVVLASTGKVFSAGGDFELMRAAHDDPVRRREIVDSARALLNALLTLPQPIVAAMQGAAIGLGATIVLGCDAVVAARTAVIADSHVNVGLVAGDGGVVIWPATAGILRARRHLLTGDPIDALTAYTLGLVTDLVDTPTEVLGYAQALAQRIAGLPPLAVQLTKRALVNGLMQRAGEAFELGLAYEETTLASDDLLEGIAAIKERRPGDFSGH